MDKKTIFIIIETIVLISVIFFGYRYFSEKVDISDQNLKAAKGEVTVLKGQNDELIYTRDSYILKEKDLEEQLGITKSELKTLKKKLDSSIAYISKLEAEILVKDVVMEKDTIIYINNNYSVIPFKYSDKWLNFKGKNDLTFDNNVLNDVKTTITEMSLSADLKVGLTDNNQIFVETDNPYIKFNSIEGAYLNKEVAQVRKVRFTYGFQLGFGVNYGIINRKIDIGPYAGAGIGISF